MLALCVQCDDLKAKLEKEHAECRELQLNIDSMNIVVRTTEHSSKKCNGFRFAVMHSAKKSVKRSVLAVVSDSFATTVSFFKYIQDLLLIPLYGISVTY